jgi:alkanesulfonate monooxygenase SsuD/methylene tetrahydromethanopterin reductase-like flavin-dependent oxidoreductase (luciferase family)
MHFAVNGGTAFAKGNVDVYRAALAKRGGPAQPKAGFAGGAAIGVMRHILVADTDAEARRLMKPAFERHLASLNWIRARHGVTDFDARNANVHRGVDFEACEANGMAIAGSPETVQRKLEAQAAELGVNYVVAYLYFGTLAHSDAMRSMQLFSSEVMPKLAHL